MLGKLPFTSQGEAASTGSGRDGPSMYSRVKAMRGNIDVSITSKNNRAFEIAFQWNNPETAAKVANAIASQFIEQNLQVREEMAMGTTDFLSVEVRRLRSELEEKERKLESFKKAYMGKLPEQLESNLNILNQLKDELDNLEKRVDMEKQQAMLLRSQLQDESTMGGGGTGEGEPSSDAAELAALRSRLRQLQSKYTDRHPDVVAAKRQIKKKLQQMEESPEVSGSVESEMDRYLSASERAIKNQLAQIGARIDSYEERIGEVRNAIRIYQARVEETPEVELQLKDLERDYETVKNRYQNLLSKKLDAQMAEELEKRQKGEQFRVIDSAVPPEQPFKPDMRRIALMTVVLGLGLGGGLAYVRESLDPAFYSVQDLEGALGQKVLISLPWEDKR
jgi:polysaccharide chain length determinant protein (PEP-CTERM system associated)